MKKIYLLSLVIVSYIMVIGLNGCGTANSTTTTTAAGGATTTTLPGMGAAMISGTITLPGGQSGTLWVGATTDSTLTATTGWKEDYYTITATDTTKSYSLPVGGASGTYYVMAVLAVGKTSFSGMPVAGDRVGEYADGNLIAGWGKTPTGTPTAIVYNAGDTITGKDFSLNVTW